MDHYSYLIYAPYRTLLLGLVLLLLAVIWTCTGKALAPYYGWVYRAKDSTSFWFNVAVYSLVGAVFIGDFFCKVN
jgi:uncharacterized RDD family membrane protein YckC